MAVSTSRMARAKGFTLIEILIVVAIIGVLAAVMIPSLMASRRSANDRTAQVYAHNVYVAGTAYVAADPSHTFPVGDCTAGLSVSAYSVPAPPTSAVASCTVGDPDADGLPDVVVTSTSGAIYHFP